MDVDVIGPLEDPAKAAIAAKRVASGATVVVWDPDAAALREAVGRLPATPPGRVCTWTGSGDDAALKAFIEEVLDPTDK